MTKQIPKPCENVRKHFFVQKLPDAFLREQIALPPGQVGAYCCSRKIRCSNAVLNRKNIFETFSVGHMVLGIPTIWCHMCTIQSELITYDSTSDLRMIYIWLQPTHKMWLYFFIWITLSQTAICHVQLYTYCLDIVYPEWYKS